ncbi:penicillin-binding protein 2 [Qipengyuania sediminis]|uniref:penicillin-binding protein 2 n=1 Tax=Qipengyuania sediminis TaxID=1532023 RepID=UPI00105A0AFE|nr:penicillin-binding protein 2 [Qipengyuania sediminis]
MPRRSRRTRRPFVSATTLETAFSRRSFAIGTAMGGLGLLLTGRLAYLSIAQNEKYQLESESNRVNLSLIPPRRGWILDRNGAPLASNRADFRVDVIPERMADAAATVAKLGEILALRPDVLADVQKRVAKAVGNQPVEIATGLDYEQFAAVSVRLPDMHGVLPQRGFSRFYPTGPSVGHLIGYVGPANAEEYARDKNPLLITPGYKIGKDGLEKQFEQRLRGVPGARRVEVTASGRIVRELDTREDVQGKPIQLTIDGPLQDYAARRIGLESGSVVVLDCESGDILCMASMPSFDPNSFSAGIGSLEYAMLQGDERVPLRNKVLKGLYPPGSTVKPMHAMAFLKAGIRPEESINCPGGLRVGNRFFRCHDTHGRTDMAKAIYQSCDTYFYHFAQRVGFDRVAAFAHTVGMGEEFDLPVASQFFGTVPDSRWKQRKFGTAWQAYDTVNSSIGQGYYLASPLQLAVMSARLATGEIVLPRMIRERQVPRFTSMRFDDEQIAYIRKAMSDVVNGPGTAGRAKLPLEGVQMAGKTGTAQVVSLRVSDGKSGPWKYRDHGLFVFFAPVDRPRYAGAVVIEHGGGSGAAYPIARDVMTFLFDPAKGMEALAALEKQWGGNAQERLARKYAAYAATHSGEVVAPAPPRDEDIFARVDAEARLEADRAQQQGGRLVQPRADPTAVSTEPAPGAASAPPPPGATTAPPR